MLDISRRAFLIKSLATAGTFSCGLHAFAEPKQRAYRRNLTFLDESPDVFHEPFDDGLDGRLLTDLSQLSDDSLITPNEHFFIRTRTPDQIDISNPWSVTVDGLVGEHHSFSVNDFMDIAEPQGEVLLECSGNNGRNRGFGLLSAANWDGVPLATLLERIDVRREATAVLVGGFDGHSQTTRGSVKGASWIFPIEQLAKHGAFLATHMNGERLPRDHGIPVRLIVPRWYGCCCIKWVNRIELVDDTAPATSQMLEFSTRTHQGGRHPLARDYRPASMDQAAMPVRVEQWEEDGDVVYFVVGIMWGGETLTKELLIRFGNDEEFVPVQTVHGQPHNNTWGLWSHEWRPVSSKRYDITLKVGDPTIRTRRLDIGYYRRSVNVEQV